MSLMVVVLSPELALPLDQVLATILKSQIKSQVLAGSFKLNSKYIIRSVKRENAGFVYQASTTD